MLELKSIVKHYETGGETVEALKGIDLEFRKSEFVSILGPSGCGKTTLLNIIGGLDQYTSGDLIIDGVSTKKYKDRDWDTYRNHKIGFVFQSYNLIPHQSVLSNVELALTLSGVSKSERKRRAKEALEKVGLGSQLKKKPNQMSGGQMQRVAIARALVNDPDIILADEPTGALDTETSVQVMDILKEISKERLIIMVTHNPDIAEKYSSRIIKMLDGNIIDDSNPLPSEESESLRECDKAVVQAAKGRKKEKKPSMSFVTSFMLSLKNLFTKKGRTTLTSFAGSIGIIGIALILSVSQGTTTYIDYIQEETLSSYPLTLQSQSVDLTSVMMNFMNATSDTADHPKDGVYRKESVANIINAYVNTMNDVKENDLKSFDNYLRAEMDKEGSPLSKAVNGVQYSYNLDLSVYTKTFDDTLLDENGNPTPTIIRSDTTELLIDLMTKYLPDEMKEAMTASMESTQSMQQMTGGTSTMNMMAGLWNEILPANDGGAVNDLIKEQYDLIEGKWPGKYDEVLLVVDENNEIADMTLYALGLLEESKMEELFVNTFSNKEVEFEEQKWSFEDIFSREYKTVLNSDCFKYNEKTGLYQDMREDQFLLNELYNNAISLKVVGVIRPSEETSAPMYRGGICYTYFLTEHLINEATDAEVINVQKENPKYDIVSGLPFKPEYAANDINVKDADFREYIARLENDPAKKAEIYQGIQIYNAVQAQISQYSAMSKEELVALVTPMFSEMAEKYGMSESEVTETVNELTKEEMLALISQYALESIPAQTKQAMASMDEAAIGAMASLLDSELASYTPEQTSVYYDTVITFSESNYEANLLKMGYVDLDKPAAINIYASSFENKDVITDAIAGYNDSVEEEKQIGYTDYIGIMMSSVTTIIDAITYVLIAFVSISLIVSSIMIGVITLISVQERTKEIGILRAIGASKKNVSRMFNAETMIVGFTAGLLGVVVTYLLCIPINAILYAVTDIPNLRAILPFNAAVILVTISVFLTLISGLIPSRSAAKKDPVVALRTE